MISAVTVKGASPHKGSFILNFVQSRSDPLRFLDLHFSPFKKHFKKTFGTLVCILIYRIFWQKVSPKLLDLVKASRGGSPPFVLKIGLQKVSQNLWFALEPLPPLLWTKSKLKLNFLGEAPLDMRSFESFSRSIRRLKEEDYQSVSY